MSIYFLNSTNRIYNDKELNKLPQILFSSGIFNTQQATQALWRTQGDFFIDADETTMNISAKAGSATLRITSGGKSQQVVVEESNPLVATVSNNTSLALRNDAVVLRVNQSIITNDQLNSAGSNAVSLVVVAGNSANTLSDQEITVALSGDPFLRLADILVPQNATAITQSMITDRRTIVRMTRATKLASDALRLYGIAEDPTVLEQGDIWFNTSEGILKMFDGTNTIAVQTRSYDWGYYPPNGVDTKIDQFTPLVENLGGVDNSGFNVWYLINALDSSTTTNMAGQVFMMPNIPNPYIRLKMGNPAYQASVACKIYTVNGSNVPQVLIQTFSFNTNDVPKNDYINLYLDGSLYTPGQTYLLVFQSTQLGLVNSSDSNFRTAIVQTSTFTDDEGYLLGTKTSAASSLTTNPLSLAWSGPTTASRNFIMSIAERDELEFGQTDSTGNVNRLSQAFVASSRDMVGFRVIKGAESGNPTDDINATLYLADSNNQPIGNALTSAVITEADWLVGGTGTDKEFNLEYDQMIIGQKYVVVIECENTSTSDNYTIYFGTTPLGKANRWNTANGWVSMTGDLFYSIIVSANRKIVVTNDQGLIPLNLFDPEQLISLLPSPAFEQEIFLSGVEVLTTNEDVCFGSNEDGSVIYLYNGNSAASNRILYRLERDIKSGRYLITHSLANPTITIPNSDNGAIVVIGEYIYVFSNNGTNVICSRFLASNLTGETAMTVPTLACTTHVTVWTNGSEVYVVSAQSDTTCNRWTISGTVMSSSTTSTVPSGITGSNRSTMWDGTNAYIIHVDDTTFLIRKLTNIDGSASETTTKNLQKSSYSDTHTGGFIIPIDQYRIYIGFEFNSYNEFNADAVIGKAIKLIPITKP